MHKRMGTTFVYVTHDQVEAMSMADDIVLMDKGKIVQQCGPRELYHNPNSIYTAQFVGSPQTNIWDGQLPDGMKLGFRPERVKLRAIDPAKGINIPARVQTKEVLGAEIIYSMDTPFGVIMCKSEEEIDGNSALTVSVAFDSMYLFGADTLRLPFTPAAQAAVAAVYGGDRA